MLTSANCSIVWGGWLPQWRKASDIVVVVVEHDQSNNSDGTRHEISNYTIHPKFRERPPKGPHDYDFSMLHLIEPVALGNLVVPACLPDLRFSGNKLVGKKLTVSGWGATKPNSSETSYLLQGVDVSVISQDDCTKAYEPQRLEINDTRKSYDITDSMICAGNETGGMDSCRYYSGGNLKIVDKFG